MFNDMSNRPRIDPGTEEILNTYNFYYIKKYKLSKVPQQDWASYVPDHTISNHFRNLSYNLMSFKNYKINAVSGMVDQGCWLVSNIDHKGIQSPLNMFNGNLHPGRKRYIVAHYLQLKSIPILLQTKEELSQSKITTLEQLNQIYQNNYSTKIKIKSSGEPVLECSWHGETNSRDSNGYDDWWKVSGEAYNYKNVILDYISRFGIEVNMNEQDLPFEIIVHDKNLLNKDFWELYFHFDPAVHRKICETKKIEIVNRLTDSKIVMKDCKLVRTLFRPKI
jgi:hypothetical protein